MGSPNGNSPIMNSPIVNSPLGYSPDRGGPFWPKVSGTKTFKMSKGVFPNLAADFRECDF